ncbi:DNA primase [Defluviimonas sp. WL0075]|uniref:DNA primase n=1 Tax=Albidovulum sediminicola TaxID=2984331 RepID=A0ABT2Z0K6_9RHOB|nr:DNA primase [Defluviimonas sp. WL0075]MCV2864547.1 DNA primase [Defluviimonas sp. WL0075]
MSLPPGFLDELRNRTTLSRIVGRKVTWDNRKSNQAKGDLWAPCPFHQEKTASFHVDDRKGYYYCFGCHAKGDAVSFLREAENMGFMEAIEVLAREAGMQMPARDPEAAQKADRRSQLAEVMEAAVQHYRMQLRTGAGAPARDYLAKRKLSEADRDRFEIGFAPEGWQGLWDHLKAKGIADDLILAAGLAKPSTKGKAPYDTFRNRIMFPIRDARGRCIAFGGRAMDPNDNAKYLNSPETELFDKGRSLYNHGPAREAAGKGETLIVAEGYMDVIALVTAGFHAAVAPLGTAITEDQLRLIWRIHPEPLVMLDGDTAGIRAAMRLIDLALPLLEAGYGLRFVILPEGMDPDDMIRARGAQAMRDLLETAQPMVNLLWRRETEGKTFDSPERKAGLDKTLRETLRKIADPSIRAHYGEEIKQLRWELFGSNRKPQPQRGSGMAPRGRSQAPLAPLPVTRTSLLATPGGEAVEDHLREAMILAICVTHPACLARFESQLETVDMLDPGHDRLRNALLLASHDPEVAADPDAFRNRIAASAGADLEKLLALAHVRIAPPVRNFEDTDLATMCLAEELAKLEARRGMTAEIEEAMEDLEGLADEGLTWRLSQAAAARHRAERSRLDDDSDMGEDRAALSAQLQSLIDRAVWEKKRH